MKSTFAIKIDNELVKDVISWNLDDDFSFAASKFDFTVVNRSNFVQSIKTNKLVTFFINDLIQYTGAIDSIEEMSDNTVRIQTRDLVAKFADFQMDWHLKITEKDTLKSAIEKALASCGITFYIESDDRAEKNIISGKKVGFKARKTYKSELRSLSKSIDQTTKPQKGEGLFRYIERICSSHGLSCWLNNAGNTLYVSTPDFDQESLYTFRKTKSGLDNVLESSLRFDLAAQPAFVYAQCKAMLKPRSTQTDSNQTAASQKGSTYKCIYVNEFAGYDLETNDYIDIVKKVLADKQSKGCEVIPIDLDKALVRATSKIKHNLYNPRTVYIEDTVSKTQDQLNLAVARKMATEQVKYMTYTLKLSDFVVDGAVINTNTICTVLDEEREIYLELWVKSRRFSMDSGGRSSQVTVVPKRTYCI